MTAAVLPVSCSLFAPSDAELRGGDGGALDCAAGALSRGGGAGGGTGNDRRWQGGSGGLVSGGGSEAGHEDEASGGSTAGMAAVEVEPGL